ncbi:hypothetical protein [Sulfitobacter sp. DSM 110093]|uniref:hypothetical protein n=1 Tax=Sulfitobacter sp. DSM 110093 TaxID=2883127 RepID=UPI001FAE1E87|nr:hypothetical protein [Sulfitobacter sp. DSM 110093]
MGKREQTSVVRAAPSQNAKRHGLTAPVPSAHTLEIYREILNNPEQCAASYVTHKVARLAWEFAEAEAQVERTSAAERAHLFGGARADAVTIDDFKNVVLDVPAMREIVFSQTTDVAAAVAAAQEAAYWKAYWKEADLLKRYRREAETRRKKAQAAYTKALVEDDPNLPG